MILLWYCEGELSNVTLSTTWRHIGSGSIAPIILYLGTRSKWAVSFAGILSLKSEKNDVTALLFLVISDIHTIIAFLYVPRLRPLVLLIRVAVRLKWAWSIFGTVLTGDNRSTQRRTCPSGTLSTTNPTWIGPGSNMCLRDERPCTDSLRHGTEFVKAWKTPTYYIRIYFLRHRKHSPTPLYGPKCYCCFGK
jgi:hypothetical protein